MWPSYQSTMETTVSFAVLCYIFGAVTCQDTTTISTIDTTMEVEVNESTTSFVLEEDTTISDQIGNESQRSFAASSDPVLYPVITFSRYSSGNAERSDARVFESHSGEPNSSQHDTILTAGEDFSRDGQFVLECLAPYPVHWSRDGLQVSPSSRDNSEGQQASNYIIRLIIGTQKRSVEEKDSGNYSCIAENNPKLTSAVYIYVPANESTSPCAEEPCGLNAICEDRHGNRSCSCLPGFVGNPDVSCREECSLNSDCPDPLVCIKNKCVDSCIGACGRYAYCQMIEQVPICNCLPGYTGDPYDVCDKNTTESGVMPELCAYCGQNTICVSRANDSLVCKCRRSYAGDPYKICEERQMESPCQPSPCGENAFCKEKYGRAICNCEENFYGDPWSKCHPECFRSEHCATNQICVQMRCKDACNSNCGGGATCTVIKPHYVDCACPEGKTGDPYRECLDITDDTTESEMSDFTTVSPS